MLDPFSRAAIIAMSVLCVAGAIALSPLRARSSSSVATPALTGSTGVAIGVPVRETSIARDPFSGEPAAVQTPVVDNAASSQRATMPPDADTLPPNLASNVIPAVPGDAAKAPAMPLVSAIVTGAHPYAMIDTDGNHEIKGIGDRVHGSPIVDIDIRGITLASGQRLTVDPVEPKR